MRPTNLTIFGCVLGLLAASQAQAGYRDLKQELETYSPPSYVQDLTRPHPEREEPVQDTDFDAELQKIAQIKSRWLKSLSRAEAVFFQPDARLLRSLRPAGTDAHAAGEALKAEFTPATLATLALLRSPRVKAAENRLRASIEAFSQVQNLDEILRQYTAFTEGLKTGVGPMKGKNPVNVAFPFPGVLALKGQIVEQEVKAAREDLEAARRETVTAARIAYWNLLFSHQAQKITAETIGLFEHLEAVARTRYEAGKASFQDVSVTKYVDSSSTDLALACSCGEHYPEAKLTVRKAGKTPLEYLKITMTDVLISSISTGGSGGEDRLTENVTLNFAKVKVEYTPQKKDGAADKTKEFTWDIQKNVK